jgi:hypothetical protein
MAWRWTMRGIGGRPSGYARPSPTLASFNLMLTIALTLIAFAGGFYAGIKNANSKKVATAKAVADILKK